MARFAANLSFLWAELPFLDRFAAAARAGFGDVEYMFPYEHPAEAIAERLREHGLRQALFNLPAGDWAAGERGIAADPSRVQEFREGVELACRYARVLDVARINCLAGLRLAGVDPAEQRRVLVGNVAHAARRLAAEGRTLLIEAVNDRDVQGFLLPRVSDALEVIQATGEGNVALQFDAYHVARMGADPLAKLEACWTHVGHVQIADNPGRHEPGSGEIDFDAFLGRLDALAYGGVVGLEYVPQGSTEASLAWLARFRADQGVAGGSQ
jgi:hydroxypyruvate isomerase